MLRGWLLPPSTTAQTSRASSSLLHAPRLLPPQHTTRSPVLHGARQQRGGPQQQPGTCCAAVALKIGQPFSVKGLKPATCFEELGLNPALLEALKSQNITVPTEIQSMAVRAIQAGDDCLVAGQTGSGKTLAYLLPLVTKLKLAEEADKAAGVERRAKRPKVVVLAPTKELTDQIASVAKLLCHYAKFRAVSCTAFSSDSKLAKLLGPPVDMVVATPTKLQQLLDANTIALGDVRWLVIDEADTMLDKGFLPEVTRVVGVVKSLAPPAQAILVSATMTKAVKQLATQYLPQLVRVEGAGLHQPVPTASHEFRAVEQGGDKVQLLLELLQGDVAKRRKVLVFCNSMDSCRAVEHMCHDRDLPTVCYHGDMPIEARRESMAAFVGAAAAPPDGANAAPSSQQQQPSPSPSPPSSPSAPPAASIMVATDLAARGLDFPGAIDHVINFDMPPTGVDYLHRAGRTARAGAKGRVTSLLKDRRDKRMAQAIQGALDQGVPLDQVTADSSGAAAAAAAGGGGPAAAAGGAGKSPGKWMPPKRDRKFVRDGGGQGVLWDPQHKFIHLDPATGQPHVPYKELLKNKGGDERRQLLWEIAMDVKEYRRWRHARACERSQKRRARAEARSVESGQPLARSGGRGGSSDKVAGKWSRTSSDPEERWKAKMAGKQQRRSGGSDGGGGGGSGGAAEQQQQRRGGGSSGPAWAGRGKQAGRGKLFK